MSLPSVVAIPNSEKRHIHDCGIHHRNQIAGPLIFPFSPSPTNASKRSLEDQPRRQGRHAWAPHDSQHPPNTVARVNGSTSNHRNKQGHTQGSEQEEENSDSNNGLALIFHRMPKKTGTECNIAMSHVMLKVGSKSSHPELTVVNLLVRD